MKRWGKKERRESQGGRGLKGIIYRNLEANILDGVVLMVENQEEDIRKNAAERFGEKREGKWPTNLGTKIACWSNIIGVGRTATVQIVYTYIVKRTFYFFVSICFHRNYFKRIWRACRRRNDHLVRHHSTEKLPRINNASNVGGRDGKP